MVVLPALSRPRMRMRTSLLPKRLWNIREKKMPIGAASNACSFDHGALEISGERDERAMNYSFR
jgi:hypothetical protein